MSNDSVTLVLEGVSIPFRDFAKAARNFETLIRALTDDLVTDERIEWVTDDLEIGSTIMTQRGQAENMTVVERVVTAYPDVGRALQQQSGPPPFPRSVIQPASRLGSLINGRVTGVRFQTPIDEYTVSAQGPEQARPLTAFGAIEGHVETLARRGALRFTVYDLLHERPVYCYAQADQEVLLRGIWGMHVIVEGLLYRNPESGHPTSMREIRNITVVPEVEAEHYKRAIS